MRIPSLPGTYRPPRARLAPLLTIALLVLATTPLGAQPDAATAITPDASPDAAASSADSPTDGCTVENLLADRAPAGKGVKNTRRLVDDTLHRDGSPWNGKRSAVFDGADAHVTWTLPEATTVRAMLVQGDNNDTYIVEGSLDGRSWSPLWTVPKHPQSGLQTRLGHGFEQRLRHLRVSVGEGDGAYALGEVQAFCTLPALWPPPLTEEDPSTGKAKGVPRKVRIAWYKIGLALCGALTLLALLGAGRGFPRPRLFATLGGVGALGLCIGAALREHGSLRSPWVGVAIGALLILLAWLIRTRDRAPDEGRPLSRAWERGLLGALLFASAFTWINVGTFHGSRVIHYWDTFHYYMGGKYFPENRYSLIYQCSAIAEVDDGRRSTFAKRQIRDLRDNTLGPAEPHLERDGECRAAFSDARWAEFRQETRLFRSYMGSSWWAKMFKDHGFNASPVWIGLGRPLTHIGGIDVPPDALADHRANLRGKTPARRAEIKARFKDARKAFERRIGVFVSIDLALYAGAFALIWWAFGLRACALAMIIWGAGYPWAYFWTGGSFGRVPWLFMAVAGMCFMARGHKALGGAGVTWAMLLRVFPGAIIAGVSVKIAWNLVRHRTISRGHRRLILGCTVALVTLVGASLPVVGGFDAYREFLGNSFKHKGTPLTNHMGLPTLLSFHPAHIARRTRDNTLDDPFAVWKEKRQSNLESRRWLHYAILLGFLGLLGYTGRRLADWQLTALSTVMIVGVFELTCYYYCFVIMLAPLAVRHFRYALALLAMAIAGQGVQLMIGWYDLQYTWETAYVLAAMLYILGDIAWRHRQLDKAGEPPPGPDTPDPIPERA